MKSFAWTALAPTLIFLSQCQHNLPSYLVTQGLQQGSVYIRARPIEEHLNDPLEDPNTKDYLRLAQEVRKYASVKFQMKTGRNYSHFVQLKNPWITHVVVAAKTDRLEAHLFEYPFFGGLPYRGYFRKEEALSFAESLKKKNLDVDVRPVSAYSTTGWLPDPVLSSMLMSPTQLIELIFHELVHLQFYVPGHADFNEAFATWFAEKATHQFIEEMQVPDFPKEVLRRSYKEQVRMDRLKYENSKEILKMARSFYESATFVELGSEEKIKSRAEFFQKIRDRFRQDSDLKRWSEVEWNNAILISLNTYYGLVDAIEAVAKEQGLSPKDLLAQTRSKPNLTIEWVSKAQRLQHH